jgi:hypothetical protein
MQSPSWVLENDPFVSFHQTYERDLIPLALLARRTGTNACPTLFQHPARAGREIGPKTASDCEDQATFGTRIANLKLDPESDVR